MTHGVIYEGFSDSSASTTFGGFSLPGIGDMLSEAASGIGDIVTGALSDVATGVQQGAAEFVEDTLSPYVPVQVVPVASTPPTVQSSSFNSAYDNFPWAQTSFASWPAFVQYYRSLGSAVQSSTNEFDAYPAPFDSDSRRPAWSGMSIGDVKAYQNYYNTKGYNLATDGIWGANTNSAWVQLGTPPQERLVIPVEPEPLPLPPVDGAQVKQSDLPVIALLAAIFF